MKLYYLIREFMKETGDMGGDQFTHEVLDLAFLDKVKVRREEEDVRMKFKRRKMLKHD
jgi:hypothetical protein